MTPIIVITGPTASGKSKLAIDFAKGNFGALFENPALYDSQACLWTGEIICADSRSVYKNFDIVSAKPSEEEQKAVAHHMLDIISPNENFSAGDFKTRAKRAIEQIQNRGKQVIICGGTWFYINALLGFVNIPSVAPNEALRDELEKKSSLVLFDMLLELNEKRAREIEPNNRERVIRAIEICLAEKPHQICETNELAQTHEIKFFTPKIEREELYERINKRVDLMIKEGLEQEYRKNKEKYGNLPIFETTIGYSEFEKFEKGIYKTREIAIEKIKQHTRNYAKRQLTWLKAFEDKFEKM